MKPELTEYNQTAYDSVMTMPRASGGEKGSTGKTRWERNFELARKYYEEHDNLNISTLYKTGDGTALGLWLRRQRQKLSDGTLKPERAERLLGIGLTEKASQNVRSNKKYEEQQ